MKLETIKNDSIQAPHGVRHAGACRRLWWPISSKIAPAKGMTGYQALIRAYVGQCLREDLEKLDDVAMKRFIASFRPRA